MTLLPPTRSRSLPGFRREMDRLIDDMLGWRRDDEAGIPGTWDPDVDVSETDDEIEVSAELPGISRDDIDISISDNVVTIKGEKQEERRPEGHQHHVERRYGRFIRSFSLPSGVDADNAEAKYEDGVLRMKLPKKEESRSRQIEVKGS